MALTIPNTLMSAKTTTTAAMQMNLNSTDDKIDQTLKPFVATDPDTYNKKGTVTVYDSLGNSHDVNVYYVKTDENKWDVYTLDSSDSTAKAVKAAQMEFNNSGTLESVTSYDPANAGTGMSVNVNLNSLNGSAAGTFNLSFLNSMQQNTGSNDIVATTQNGFAPGNLVSYQINEDGTVVGNYSNQQSQLLGQIVLANFANNEGLQSEGDNVWSATQSSGVALLGTAGTGNFGTLTNGALEASNVDLSKELVNMIVAQRNYQSNAQTIKTQDQILNTLVNLR